jgi:hypothetical protein
MRVATRERLPNRREAETFDVEAGGLRYRATIGRYADGRLAEIFVVNHKAGSQAGHHGERCRCGGEHRAAVRGILAAGTYHIMSRTRFRPVMSRMRVRQESWQRIGGASPHGERSYRDPGDYWLSPTVSRSARCSALLSLGPVAVVRLKVRQTAWIARRQD